MGNAMHSLKTLLQLPCGWRCSRQIISSDGITLHLHGKSKTAQCPECFYTFEPPKFGRPVCPACGYVFPKKERSLDTEEAELQKITGFVLDYDSPEQCRNMQELNAYAKKMGYKKGWAYFQGKQRGFI